MFYFRVARGIDFYHMIDDYPARAISVPIYNDEDRRVGVYNDRTGVFTISIGRNDRGSYREEDLDFISSSDGSGMSSARSSIYDESPAPAYTPTPGYVNPPRRRSSARPKQSPPRYSRLANRRLTSAEASEPPVMGLLDNKDATRAFIKALKKHAKDQTLKFQ